MWNWVAKQPPEEKPLTTMVAGSTDISAGLVMVEEVLTQGRCRMDGSEGEDEEQHGHGGN